MNITHLQSFITVAETGSFTKAAQALFITQSSLSRHISALEEYLGVQLLVRNRHYVDLTPEGQLLYREGRQILDHMHSLERRLSEAGNGSGAKLDLIASPMYSQGIRDIYQAFLRRYPHVTCNLKQVTYGQEINTLLKNEADISIVVYPHDTFEDPSLQICTISVEPLCLVSGVDDDIAQREVLTMDDFMDETLIISDSPASPWLESIHAAIAPYFKNITRVNNIDSVILNLSFNNGIAIWPMVMAQGTQNYSKVLNVPDFQYSTRLCALWAKDNTNPYIKKFLQLCERG